MSDQIKSNDLQIRRQRLKNNLGVAGERFTVHRWPSGEQLGGAYQTESLALRIASAVAIEQGVEVWLESDSDSSRFVRIPSRTSTRLDSGSTHDPPAKG